MGLSCKFSLKPIHWFSGKQLEFVLFSFFFGVDGEVEFVMDGPRVHGRKEIWMFSSSPSKKTHIYSISKSSIYIIIYLIIYIHIIDMSNDMKLTSPDGILKSGFPALEDGRSWKMGDVANYTSILIDYIYTHHFDYY